MGPVLAIGALVIWGTGVIVGGVILTEEAEEQKIEPPIHKNDLYDELKLKLEKIFQQDFDKVLDDPALETQLAEFFNKVVDKEEIEICFSIEKATFLCEGGNYKIRKVKDQDLIEKLLKINFENDRKKKTIDKIMELTLDLSNSLRINEIAEKKSSEQLNKVKKIAYSYKKETKMFTFCFYYAYYENKSLDECLEKKKFDTHKEKLEFALSLAAAIELLDENKVFHGDLKPSNILISDDLKPVMHDFETSKIGSSKTTKYYYDKTTVLYAAYETFKSPSSYEINQTSNIYSYGCIIFELFSGFEPWKFLNLEKDNDYINFLKDTKKDLIESYKEEEEKIKDDHKNLGGDEIVDLIKNCTCIDAKSRISSKEVIEILENELNKIKKKF